MHTEPLICPNCQSHELRGLTLRGPDGPPSVFIACAQCELLLASFRVDHGFLNSTDPEAVAAMLGNRVFESGRELTESLESLRAEAQQRYEIAIADAKTPAPDPPDETPDT